MKDPEGIKRSLRETYDAIAPHFSERRKELWAPMKLFIDEVSPCTIADLGCGAGRSLIYAANKGCTVIGIDTSSGQLEMAAKNLRDEGVEEKVELIRSDLEELDMKDECWDHCMIIASLHHIPDRIGRIRSLDEAHRCTEHKGRILISVWSWDQERFREDHLSRINGERIIGELDGPEPGDVYVPWKEGVTRLRFYHLYGPGELEDEIASSRWSLSRSYFDGRNHWAECIKDP